MKKCFVVFSLLTPVISSLLLIGAHFLRSGNFLVPILSLLLILALGIREPVVARMVQFALLLATAEWIHVTFALVSARLEAGLPWAKLVIILGVVGTLSLASIGIFFTKTLKERYHLSFDPGQEVPGRVAAQAPSATEISQAQLEVSSAEHRQKLLTVHYLKSTLSVCSLFVFLLMDFSFGFGVAAFVVIAIIHTALRTRLQAIGGVLSLADRKKLYLRQALGLCLLAVSIIGYYSISLSVLRHRLIVAAIITGFTFLLWAAARYEYLPMGQER